MYYTYVIRSRKDGRLYTGSTCDLRKRLKDHNDGKVRSTKGRRPFDLIYYEACINEQDARAREKYLKTGMGKRYIRNRMRRFLSHTTSLRDKSLTGFNWEDK
ncbi:GIY-YIG nuclease family protein [candidate division WOR-3 bacterium]|nr:GIY-YIG nuclease family protein [candidate division WOR-3 bacterium]